MKRNQAEINRKISESLKGRCVGGSGFKTGYDVNRKKLSPLDWERAKEVRSKKRQSLYSSASWDELPIVEKRRRVLSEQNGKCLLCQLDSWLANKLVLEFDHLDGNNKNNNRDNVRFLCPNCHSQTPTWRRKKSSV